MILVHVTITNNNNNKNKNKDYCESADRESKPLIQQLFPFNLCVMLILELSILYQRKYGPNEQNIPLQTNKEVLFQDYYYK